MNNCYLLLVLAPVMAFAQGTGEALPDGWADDVPAIESLVSFARTESDLRVAISRYVADKAVIGRRYEVQFSPARIDRLREFTQGWQAQLAAVDFEALNSEGQIDYILLRNRLRYDLELLSQQETRRDEMAPLLPFFDDLRLLQEDRHNRKRVEPRKVAGQLDQIAGQLDTLISGLPAAAMQRDRVSPVVAWRASNQLDHIRHVLADWNTFYSGYDPMFNFWVPEPYTRLDESLAKYAQAIREHLVGITAEDKAPIIGDPVLADGLRADLAVEMIPYSPTELLEIGRKEFAWIEEQFRIVSRRMGYGDDWKAALEHTKNLAPEPGEKPWIIFDIADYSEEYVESMGNITMPPLAREVWRLRMQTPEDQLRSPFFTGGEETRVSYPTNTMAHRDKLMSMRGNTPHFNFGTVQHELLPGHHMQGGTLPVELVRARLTGQEMSPDFESGWRFYRDP